MRCDAITTRVTVFGPPGTGKTTAGIALCQGWLAEGVRPDEIAYLGFTRASARAALDKVIEEIPGAHVEDYTGFRTIHSLCYRLMREARRSGGEDEYQVMRPFDWKRFAQETGMKGRYSVEDWEDVAGALGALADFGMTEWDKIRTAYTLSRVTAGSIEELDAARIRPGDFACRRLGLVYQDQYGTFVQAYEKFKRREGLIDFSDMLEFVARNVGPQPQYRKVVVDEVQDLSRVHHLIMNKLFDGVAENFTMIGDDYQAIFTWSGADPAKFLEEARRGKRLQLTQTHRFGDRIVRFSKRIADRLSIRQDKDVVGVPGKEHRIEFSGQFKPSAGAGFILHRHVMGCHEIARSYMASGLPFRNLRGKDPLGYSNRVKAFETIRELAVGRAVPAHEVSNVFQEIVPSTVVAEGNQSIRLVVHGAKKKIAEGGGNAATMNLGQLVESRTMTPEGAQVIRERRYALLKHSEDLAYYTRLVENGYGLDGSGGPTISTVHGVKGEQAPRVTVFREMSRKCWDDPDGEHRVAYVAATRTQGDLEICSDRLVDWAMLTYDYPGNDDSDVSAS